MPVGAVSLFGASAAAVGISADAGWDLSAVLFVVTFCLSLLLLSLNRARLLRFFLGLPPGMFFTSTEPKAVEDAGKYNV